MTSLMELKLFFQKVKTLILFVYIEQFYNYAFYFTQMQQQIHPFVHSYKNIPTKIKFNLSLWISKGPK